MESWIICLAWALLEQASLGHLYWLAMQVRASASLGRKEVRSLLKPVVLEM